LLDEALDRPRAEREQWLEGLAPQFESLKPQLRDLLSRSAVVETGDFLSAIPPLCNPGAGDTAASAARQARAGDVVGPYRLVRELGAGGMGAVWLAERADGLIVRPIALKLPHVVTPRRAELADRMAREREILATLDHPNIARLLDAGLTSEGQPFLALEYVEGIPIDRYCDGGEGHAPATLDQRLRLFLQVANAVAYAHGRLVVHRDLKPANILVTSQGEVRLLDFGIAKLLDEGQARATRLTELSGRAMTPDYASPEQILGEPLTVASDVYSLGVVLYELLSGARPYQLKRDSRGALEDAIVQVQPRRPSEVVAPPAQRRALRGDLDTITLKALKKAPHERYATVNALGEDISRYLSSRPVLARPDTRWYRVRKFVARNKLSLAASAVVALAVLAGAGVAVWQARVAIAERDRAETVKALISSIFEDADINASGKALSATDLLLRADREFRARPIADPRVRAELTTMLARGLFSLNEDAASERLASEALAAARKALPPDDPNLLRLDVLVAEQKRYRGETGEALALVNEALAHFGKAPERFGKDYVRALIVRADILIDTDEGEAAITAARKAVETARRVVGEDHLTLWAMSSLGQALDAAGQAEEALEVTREALQATKRVTGGDDRDPMAIDARMAYAKALGGIGRYDLASDELVAAIRDAAAVHGARSVEVGVYSQNAAVYQLKAGRIRDAIESATLAMEIRAGALAENSTQSLATRYVYARGLLLGRRASDALPVLSGLQQGMASALGPLDVRTLEARSAYAIALAYTGSLAEARAVAEEAIAAASRKGAEATHLPWHASAMIFRLQGDARAALEHESTALRRMSDQATSAERAEVLSELGSAQAMTGDAVSAERNLLKSLEQLDVAGHTATPVRADAQARLARLWLSQNRAKDALPLAQQADEFWRGFDDGNRAAGEAALWLGRARLALGQRQEANEALVRARKLLTGSPLPSDAELLALTAAR
jgi:serine/threonine-protein kinase